MGDLGGSSNRRPSVSFSPNRDRDGRPSAELLLSDSTSGRVPIKYVRLCWIDFAGLVRIRVVPKRRYEKMLQSPLSGLIAVTAATIALSHHDEVGVGFAPVGDVILFPDKNSYRPLPYEPGHAMVMCSFLRRREVSPGELSPNPDRPLDSSSDPPLSSLSAYPLCPRLLLSTTLQQSVVESGVSYMIGFELELVLLSQTKPAVVPVDGERRDHAWSRASAMRSGSEGYAIVTKIVEVLEEAGVTVEQWHPESAPGQVGRGDAPPARLTELMIILALDRQFEIILAPHAPFQAADELVFARECIYNVANTFGVRASFTPKPFLSAAGNGAHTHISLHRRKRTTPTSSPRMGPAPFPSPSSKPMAAASSVSIIESHFVAGILHHLPAITAFTMPSAFSYDRVGASVWSGGLYVAWGAGNREVPVRLCSQGPGQNHFEIKTMDATCNIYLALSAILTAGLLGIKTPLELLQPNCRVDPSKLSPAERAQARLTTLLPKSIDEALAALEGDTVLHKSLGSVMCRAYIGCKKAEAERYRALKPDEKALFAVEQY